MPRIIIICAKYGLFGSIIAKASSPIMPGMPMAMGPANAAFGIGIPGMFVG